jgi:hypothetical protein
MIKKRNEKNFRWVLFQFLAIKTMDPNPDPKPDSYPNPDPYPYPYPDSLKMLDPDPFSDPDSMNPDPQRCREDYL